MESAQVPEEVLALYRDAYVDENHLPDLRRMQDLLTAGVCLEVFNPYTPAEQEHWSYHENLLTHVDLEHVLPPHSETALGRHAKTAVGILVAGGCLFEGYQGRNEDDVQYGITEALLFGEYEKFGVSAEDAITRAVANGLILPSFGVGLKGLRAIIERQRSPSVHDRVVGVVSSAKDYLATRKVRKASRALVERIKSQRSA